MKRSKPKIKVNLSQKKVSIPQMEETNMEDEQNVVQAENKGQNCARRTVGTGVMNSHIQALSLF